MNPVSKVHPWIAAIALLALAACSAPGQPRAEHATREGGSPTYPGVPCHFVGLEAEQGSSDQNSDAVTLFAVYRFSERDVPPPKQPLSLVFRVSRSRVGELRDHLAATPEVICVPDSDRRYRAEVAPF